MRAVENVGGRLSGVAGRSLRAPLHSLVPLLLSSPRHYSSSPVPCSTLQPGCSISPTVHRTVAAAHIHASRLLAELVEVRQPSSLAAYMAVTEEWWSLVEQQVQLPWDAEEIQDLPQFLLECVLPGGTNAVDGTASAAAEAQAVSRWEEWVWTSAPRHAVAPVALTTDAGDTRSRSRDGISFPLFTQLISTYVRYHRGVRWGASRRGTPFNSPVRTAAPAAAAAASFYRRLYTLHPWHGMHCPEGTAQQLPYVHILSWMLEGGEGRGGGTAPPSAAELWERHRAVEPFRLPTITTATSGFKALDVCSQSGHALDLLFKAGAGVVVAADSDAMALGNTEATYHEILRAKRSPRQAVKLYTRRSDGLPSPPTNKEQHRPALKAEALSGAPDGPHGTSASAAELRRRRARREGRGYNGFDKSVGCHSPSICDDDAAIHPFDLVYIHPPSPASVWPVMAVQLESLHHTAWWRSLTSRIGGRGGGGALAGAAPAYLLPFLPCGTAPAPGRHTPLATPSGLRQVIDRLRADAMGGGGSISLGEGPHLSGAPPPPSLLTEDGYAALILPRTFDPGALVRREAQGGPSLADEVVAQLEGAYDLVLRRRARTRAASSRSVVAPLEPLEEALMRLPSRLSRGEALDLRKASSSTWATELRRLYHEDVWQEALILKRNAQMARACGTRRQATWRPNAAMAETRQRRCLDIAAVPWEDSFEFNEYHPRHALPHTTHHWTQRVPTYSYLEDDFYDTPTVEQNFLAVGHPCPMQKRSSYAMARAGIAARGEGESVEPTKGNFEAAQQASFNFHALFAQELRTHRRSKLRRLALSPLQQQEWYIDEKLVKSNAARLELLNQFAKWDLKDYDR